MKPIAEFSLTIRTHNGQRSRKKLRVLVWKRLQDLRTAAHKLSTCSARYWRSAGGAYNGILVYNQDGRLVQFGRVHLWERLIGSGYVEHELQHFKLHYIEATESWPLDPDADERICWMAGDLTNQFWRQYYAWQEAHS